MVRSPDETRGPPGATFLASVAVLAAAVPAVSGETTHTYAVTLTIEVDRAEHKVKGMVESPRPRRPSAPRARSG